ncbi:HNH endonuclease [Variovorax sp. LjRoot175]|uniref:HNH endonuclease n=1 Tax=Variovorax sp. LjRoot175 TaxID=3342276 RepID=UPI003F50F494
MHRVRERSRKLVEQAKKLALKKHGRLFCEACKFDFADRYGAIGQGLIDVHHTKPVHTLAEGDRTSVEDLALLCANCHRVVHSSRKWLSVAEVAALVRSTP